MNGGYLLDGLSHHPLDRCHVVHSTYDHLLTSLESLKEQGGNSTFVGAEVHVSRTQSQPIRLSDCSAQPNHHTEIQILHKLPNQRGLLVVFLAKQGDMGLYDPEKFRHYRGDPSEVMRPDRPFPSTSNHGNRHSCLKAFWIHVPGSRLKADIDSFLAAQCTIASNRAGIRG